MQKYQRDIQVFPSLLCGDLYNIERTANDLFKSGYRNIHVDILDGHFSPSMPLGLDSVMQLKNRSNLDLDVHVMSTNNEFFVEELLKTGCMQMCFHYETTSHVDRMLQMIKSNGVRAGIALKPATPVWMIEEIAEYVDYVLLMLINPGYAGNKNEQQVTYAIDKIRHCREMFDKKGLETPIEIDGRIRFDRIEAFLNAGANYFVGGSGLSFCPGYTLEENKQKFDAVVKKWREDSADDNNLY